MSARGGGAAPHAGPTAWLLLGLFAAALRWIRWERTAVLFNDGPVFIELARALARGDVAAALAHDYHPLYPAAIALFAPAVGDFELAGAVVSIVGGALATVALAWLMAGAYGPRTGLVAGWLAAVHPIAIEVSADVQSEGLYLAFFAASVALSLAVLRRGRARAAVGAGLASGAAYLVRPEGLGAGLGLLAALAGLAILRRLPAGRALGLGAVAAAGIGVAVAPYAALLSWEAGEVVLTRKKSLEDLTGLSLRFRLPAEVRPPAAGPPRVGTPEPASPSRAAEERGLAAGLADLGETTLSTLRPEFLLLLLVGLRRRAPPDPARTWLLGALLLLFGAVLALMALEVGYVSRRHVLPPALLLLGRMALGVEGIAAWLAARIRSRDPARGAAASIAIAALAVAAPALGKALRPARTDALPERRAAEWLAASGLPSGRLAAHRRRVAYYAGLPYQPLRLVPDARPRAYLADKGVRYVIADLEEYPWVTRESGLRPLHFEEHEGIRVGVFEVVPAGPVREGG